MIRQSPLALICHLYPVLALAVRRRAILPSTLVYCFDQDANALSERITDIMDERLLQVSHPLELLHCLLVHDVGETR